MFNFYRRRKQQKRDNVLVQKGGDIKIRNMAYCEKYATCDVNSSALITSLTSLTSKLNNINIGNSDVNNIMIARKRPIEENNISQNAAIIPISEEVSRGAKRSKIKSRKSKFKWNIDDIPMLVLINLITHLVGGDISTYVNIRATCKKLRDICDSHEVLQYINLKKGKFNDINPYLYRISNLRFYGDLIGKYKTRGIIDANYILGCLYFQRGDMYNAHIHFEYYFSVNNSLGIFELYSWKETDVCILGTFKYITSENCTIRYILYMHMLECVHLRLAICKTQNVTSVIYIKKSNNARKYAISSISHLALTDIRRRMDVMDEHISDIKNYINAKFGVSITGPWTFLSLGCSSTRKPNHNEFTLDFTHSDFGTYDIRNAHHVSAHPFNIKPSRCQLNDSDEYDEPDIPDETDYDETI